ncbi:hypothetical protein [Ekhidna sp.]|uniref:hypothetical protein n=1 Tax=Ekhidna sp. TaxID=2608089 RepID=UPI003B512825
MRCFTIFLLTVLTITGSYSQQQLDITLGAGYTAIDLDKVVEKDEVSGTRLEDWDQANFGISAQYFFTSFGEVQFGLEAMYQHLYWYRVIVPFGSTPIDREYTITAGRISGIFRFGSENASFDLGPTLNFNNGTQLGLMLSGNKYFPIADNIDIPLKLRIDVIDGIVVYAPISLNTGIRVRL